jgi:hypothetical protein
MIRLRQFRETIAVSSWFQYGPPNSLFPIALFPIADRPVSPDDTIHLKMSGESQTYLIGQAINHAPTEPGDHPTVPPRLTAVYRDAVYRDAYIRIF